MNVSRLNFSEHLCMAEDNRRPKSPLKRLVWAQTQTKCEAQLVPHFTCTTEIKRMRKREHMLCITPTSPLFLPYFHHMWPETTGKLTANKLFSPTLSAPARLPKCQYTDALSNFQPLAKFHQWNLFPLRGPMCLVGAQQERKTWMNQSQLKVNAKYSPC